MSIHCTLTRTMAAAALLVIALVVVGVRVIQCR